MNLEELLNQSADDLDVGTMADPIEIRRTGDLRTARGRRTMVIVCATFLLAAIAVLQIRVSQNRTEPAPSISPHGSAHVAYLTHDGISFVADDGSRRTLPAKNVDRFALSPDGQQIAYITYARSSNWLWFADTRGIRRNRQPPPCTGCMPGYGLTWSNDGTQLAYSVITAGQHRRAQLRIRTVSTGEERAFKMPRGCDARGPRFSPNDRILAMNLSCEHGTYEAGQYLATLDPGQGAASLAILTRAYHQVQLPSWSTDGRVLYFTATTSGDDTSDTSGTGDLFAVSPDGTDLRQITHAAVGERYVAATPEEDKFLINRAYDDGPWQIGWLSADGTTFTPMRGPGGGPLVGAQPDLQP